MWNHLVLPVTLEHTHNRLGLLRLVLSRERPVADALQDIQQFVQFDTDFQNLGKELDRPLSLLLFQIVRKYWAERHR